MMNPDFGNDPIVDEVRRFNVRPPGLDAGLVFIRFRGLCPSSNDLPGVCSTNSIRWIPDRKSWIVTPHYGP